MRVRRSSYAARIVSIDGRDTVGIETSSGGDNLAVGYHEGTRTILAQLVGKEHVPVEYRENPLASIKTAYVDVSADMVDPWVSRIAFSPSIAVNEARGQSMGSSFIFPAACASASTRCRCRFSVCHLRKGRAPLWSGSPRG